MHISITDSNIGDSKEDAIKGSGEFDLTIVGSTISGSGGSAINIAQFTASDLDEETKNLLLELKESLIAKDSNNAKKVLSVLADKSVDLIIALAAGKLLNIH